MIQEEYEFQGYYLPKVGHEEIPQDVKKTEEYFSFVNAYYFKDIILALKRRFGQEWNDDDKDKLLEMFHLYLLAWEKGIEAAGVNLLHHLFIVKYGLQQEYGNKVTFTDRVTDIIDGLIMLKNPAGEYYKSIFMMADLLDNGLDEETNFNIGNELLFKLWTDGNEYAVKYISSIYSMHSKKERY